MLCLNEYQIELNRIDLRGSGDLFCWEIGLMSRKGILKIWLRNIQGFLLILGFTLNDLHIQGYACMFASVCSCVCVTAYLANVNTIFGNLAQMYLDETKNVPRGLPLVSIHKKQI